MDGLSQRGRDDLATVFVGRPPGAEHAVEFVDGSDGRLSRAEKWVINVSTQFGCAIGCRFCDAGGFFGGSLDAAQILAQVRHVADRRPDLVARCRKLKVHFSRMGEPALNPAVLDVLDRLPRVLPAPNLWACVATVAPAGTDAWFDGLAARQRDLYPGRFQLQFSVNSPDEDARRALMPHPLRTLAWIAQRGARHFRPGDRTIVLNFALAAGVPFDPGVVIAWFDPEIFAVKLTPLNPTDRARAAGLATVLRSARSDSLSEPIARLVGAGFDVIVSVGDGREDAIGSNCGQSVRRLDNGKTRAPSCDFAADSRQ